MAPQQQLQPVLPKNTITVQDIKKCIPQHLFERPLLTSFRHVAEDLLSVYCTYLLFSLVENFAYSIHPVIWFCTLAAYVFLQGVNMTGLWVLAHECGHGAFSSSSLINDLVGLPLHTCLYVPYFAWKRSHAKHHHYTNNLEKDEVWVPNRYESNTDTIIAAQSVGMTWADLTAVTLLGWPLYLLLDTTSHKKDHFENHFLPECGKFLPHEYWLVHVGSAALVAWTGCLCYLAMQITGWVWLFKFYVLPLLVVNFFLVMITYLQHTDTRVPHMKDAQWHWLGGALCTIDRTMGSYLDYKLHYIHHTHVCHHIFSTLPFYHSLEATEYIKKVVPEYYMYDPTNWFVSLFYTTQKCLAISQHNDAPGIYWWNKTK